VAAAVQSGLSPTGAAELRNLVHEFSDTFALRVGSKPPASFLPMTLDLLEGATPVLARPRPLSTDKRKFSKQFTDQLLTYGLAYRNPTSTWAHPFHIVDKPGPARYRFTEAKATSVADAPFGKPARIFGWLEVFCHF
jgi:hypothetical protein